MTTRERLIRAARKGEIRAPQIAKQWGLSRQAIAAHLKKLVEEGTLEKVGQTRSARYRIKTKQGRSKPLERYQQAKKIEGLEEHQVLSEVSQRLSLPSRLNRNALDIFSYAYTEMLNNAIDHSRGDQVFSEVVFEGASIYFEVRDYGIGVFANVQKKFKLSDEFAALEHVLKGKQTTAPEAHSGEGIFFTSRIADFFLLRSHRLQLTLDKKDVFVSEQRYLKGTRVRFGIRGQTKKSLRKLFDAHTSEEFQFDKNTLRVKVSSDGGALSRSQARRLLYGLDAFRVLIFDFRGVSQIGQAFADEIFRVYRAKRGPNVVIDYQNANRAVEFMIKRAQN